MMIYSTTVLALPCVLMVWASDSYLFVLFVRVVCGGFVSAESSPRWCQSLSALTDPVVDRARSWLARITGSAVPDWAGWAAVICGLVLARSVLVRLAVAGA